MSTAPRSAPADNDTSAKQSHLTTTTTKRSSKMSGTQSLNHLLNFTLPPRQTQVIQSIPRRSRKPVSGQGVWNKEISWKGFVNAQYRFVMNPNGDYTVHFADPDIFFQWQDILQVIVPRESALAVAAGRQDDSVRQDEGHTTCPICLSPPSAPRMTKCGHVFCYPCVLHYLNTSDHAKWNRCPICFDSINEKQLKSVKWFTEDDSISSVYGERSHEASQVASSSSSQGDLAEYTGETLRPGSVLHMRLMERPQISTLALPRSQTWPSDLIPPHQAPFHFIPDVFRFSRFMLATPDYLLSGLSRDLDDLASDRRILQGMKDDLSVSFVDLAEEKVRRQMEKAAALETPSLTAAIARARQGIRDIEVGFQERERKSREKEKPVSEPVAEGLGEVPEAFLQTLQMTSIPAPAKPTTSSRDRRNRRNLNPPPPSTSTYYFYQATSGAPIFMHPLDIRILLSHFHSYSSFPNTISVRVEASSEGAVNDELRRRCKYLAHMPESADVVFVEVDLTSVVGEEGLRAFEAPLRMRRTKRREKGRKDERARVRAEEREREKLSLPVPVPNFQFVASPTIERPSSPEPSLSPPPAQRHAGEQPSHEPSQTGGAWGQRSFASAVHNPAPVTSRARSSQPQSRAHRDADVEDEWEMDAAWHELERGRGSGRKRGNKLVVLGGAGGRRR